MSKSSDEDRARVNEAPSDLHPAGFDRFCEVEPEIVAKVEAAMTRRYGAVLIPESCGTWTALYPDLPGTLAVGDTPDQAIASLESVLWEWLYICFEKGLKVSEPSEFWRRESDRSPQGRDGEAGSVHESTVCEANSPNFSRSDD